MCADDERTPLDSGGYLRPCAVCMYGNCATNQQHFNVIHLFPVLEYVANSFSVLCLTVDSSSQERTFFNLVDY